MLSLAAQRCSPVRAFHEGIRAGGTTVCFQLLLLLPRTQHGFSGQRSAGRGCCRCSGRDARSPPALIPLRTSITGSQAGLMTVTEWNCILMSDNLCLFFPPQIPPNTLTHSDAHRSTSWEAGRPRCGTGEPNRTCEREDQRL